ncbi:uncharacterized protein APUU_10913S [Aspergillus puulaauensis]|uniref:Uncharacterized protein n=1 Tax=Aspergillus puulaauensis TaxID=1220207 RepID=A0A7R8AHY6_9EURO|nr:uncharacterized protein APUU_10913S [Aspergillus puulaauensis]BCS18085.1 hypothetical protein APUU_10913S [Aspergillus puulaauensis]
MPTLNGEAKERWLSKGVFIRTRQSQPKLQNNSNQQNCKELDTLQWTKYNTIDSFIALVWGFGDFAAHTLLYIYHACHYLKWQTSSLSILPEIQTDSRPVQSQQNDLLYFTRYVCRL